MIKTFTRITILVLFISIISLSCSKENDSVEINTDINLDTCLSSNFRVLLDSSKYHLIPVGNGFVVGGHGISFLNQFGKKVWQKDYRIYGMAKRNVETFWILTISGELVLLDEEGKILVENSVDVAQGNDYKLYSSNKENLFLTVEPRDEDQLIIEKRDLGGEILLKIKIDKVGRARITNLIEDKFENLYVLTNQGLFNEAVLFKYKKDGELLWSKVLKVDKKMLTQVNFDLTTSQTPILFSNGDFNGILFLDENGDNLENHPLDFKEVRFVKTLPTSGYILFGLEYDKKYPISYPYMLKINFNGKLEYKKDYRIQGTDMFAYSVIQTQVGFAALHSIYIPRDYNGSNQMISNSWKKGSFLIKWNIKGESCN